jgi:ATP-dependent exoDNAse (exonuclease V) beta subunit
VATRRRGPDDRQLGFEGLWGAAGAPETTTTPPPPRPSVPFRLHLVRPEPPTLEGPGDEAPEEALPRALQLSEALRLERNLSLSAGAGTGKTYSLVTMCLHLLGGARSGFEPVECARLGLLTFTEKAAGEMRERLRARLEALASERGEEPELRASFAGLGVAFPGKRFWREARDGLGSSTIGTFHSLCSQLLRRATASRESGANPGFELLDERDARALVGEVVERSVLRAVQAGSPELRHLVSEFGFGGSGSYGLVDALVPVYARIREEGQSPRFVPVADGAWLRRQFDAALVELRARTQRAFSLANQHRDRLDAFARLLEGLTFENTPELLPRLRRALGNVRQEPFGSLRPFLRTHARGEAGGEENLQLLHGACVMAPHEVVVRELLTEVEAEHRRLLERRGVLDFTGLLVSARDLLRDSLEARRAAQARFSALLVDEFQDTNRLQLELVLLLSERRDGAARPVSTAFEIQHQEILQLPLEPGFTAVVGDRKQSIYEFRGADVSVFATMTRCLEREGGATAFLKSSRRSSPALVTALNALMAKLLGQGPSGPTRRDFDVAYHPDEDDLIAVRTTSAPGRPLVRLVSAPVASSPARSASEAWRLADAEAIAAHLAASLADPHSMVISRGGGEARRTCGGDVAILFQRFTQLEVYRQALVRHGVRHRVVRGRGFFGAQEVVDVACLISLVANPDDAVAFAAVLRSPFVSLSDTALVELALEVAPWRPGLHPRDVLEAGRVPATAGELERSRLARFVELFAVLRREHDLLGLGEVLHLALERTGFAVAVAGSPFGEQALANLGKLLELASAADAQGLSTAAFAAQLLELADAEPGEAQGEVIDALDPDAVTVCTVHQAKGLEWPVVVLPDLAAVSPAEKAPVRFDRLAGLGVKPPATDEGELQSLSIERIGELRGARATAERLRLLYVAMTRARDRVVLGLLPERPRVGTWAGDLKGPLQWADVRTHLEELDVGTLPRPAVVEAVGAQGSAGLDEGRRILDSVRAAHPAEAAVAMLPVTQLMDFERCPKRYHYAHQLGLRERHRTPDGVDDAEPVDGDGRTRGTAAHRLLELVPFELEGARLQQALRELRRAEGLEARAGADVLEWVRRLCASDFGRRLRSLGEARVHRELPFVLSLRGEGRLQLRLRGQIDLLLDDEVLTVVDYKTSLMPPAGLEAYRFQLRCYALAARRFAGRPVPVRAGVSFLKEPDPAPRFLAEPLELEALEVELVEQARALLRAQASGHWPRRDRGWCDALGCGYVDRCHTPRA